MGRTGALLCTWLLVGCAVDAGPRLEVTATVPGPLVALPTSPSELSLDRLLPDVGFVLQVRHPECTSDPCPDEEPCDAPDPCAIEVSPGRASLLGADRDTALTERDWAPPYDPRGPWSLLAEDLPPATAFVLRVEALDDDRSWELPATTADWRATLGRSWPAAGRTDIVRPGTALSTEPGIGLFDNLWISTFGWAVQWLDDGVRLAPSARFDEEQDFCLPSLRLPSSSVTWNDPVATVDLPALPVRVQWSSDFDPVMLRLERGELALRLLSEGYVQGRVDGLVDLTPMDDQLGEAACDQVPADCEPCPDGSGDTCLPRSLRRLARARGPGWEPIPWTCADVVAFHEDTASCPQEVGWLAEHGCPSAQF